MPEIASRMTDVLFAEPGSGTPAAFRAYMERDIAKWKTVGETVKLPQ
jgi:hypothetical protein